MIMLLNVSVKKAELPSHLTTRISIRIIAHSKPLAWIETIDGGEVVITHGSRPTIKVIPTRKTIFILFVM